MYICKKSKTNCQQLKHQDEGYYRKLNQTKLKQTNKLVIL